MDKHLHIVSFDIPWPADYGGVMDVFHKLKALSEAGIKIHLHCFYKDRDKAPVLDQLCYSVDYYKRSIVPGWLPFLTPYIIASRSSHVLLKNLQVDDHPILFEGIHTTAFADHPSLAKRKKFIRLHNIEHRYYERLAAHEKSLFRKIYYTWEARVLKRAEANAIPGTTYIALSETDQRHFEKKFNQAIFFLPVFGPWTHVNHPHTAGCFCLYHGNLSVNENAEAAAWLIKDVFRDSPLNLVIAGKKPPSWLVTLANEKTHTCVVADPSEQELHDMIAKAQVHVLPSLNATGVKLKLLQALFSGRTCVVNEAAVSGSGLERTCIIASDANSFKDAIASAYTYQPSETDWLQRKEILGNLYDNKKNAAQLIAWIY